MSHPHIKGFLNRPKRSASGAVYTGRMVCYDVQWTGEGADAFATFTVTAEEIANAADNQMLWTDQDVQRGVQPGSEKYAERLLPVGAGYPDPRLYIFNAENADNMVEKLLTGERLFLNPLVWNLRPNTFEAYWDKKNNKIYIYDGKIFLPDSHHRHQAIIKAVKVWKETRSSYPRFTENRQFKVELYFLPREDEGNYFFDKNQRPRPTAKSKAYDLTTLDDLSLLAKKVIDRSESLKENVNRVTDRLSAKAPHVMTLSTLREMMKNYSSTDSLDAAEMEGLSLVAAKFYDLLAEVRPELGHVDIKTRGKIRDNLLVDQAVMMHGYAALMKEFNETVAEKGLAEAVNLWKKRLARFSSEQVYRLNKWRGDLFAKNNPLWRFVGVVKPSKDPRRLTVINTGGARAECARVLKQLSALDKIPDDLEFLESR